MCNGAEQRAETIHLFLAFSFICCRWMHCLSDLRRHRPIGRPPPCCHFAVRFHASTVRRSALRTCAAWPLHCAAAWLSAHPAIGIGVPRSRPHPLLPVFIPHFAGPSSSSTTPIPVRSTTPPYPPPDRVIRFPPIPPLPPQFGYQQQPYQANNVPFAGPSHQQGNGPALPQDQLASLLALTGAGAGQSQPAYAQQAQ